MADPGSDENPLRLDQRVSIPRVLDNGVMLDRIPQEDAVFAVATVVTRDGRIANYELLESERPVIGRRDSAAHAIDVAALLHEVKQARFAPAQTEAGRPVAVNMVWVILRTTVGRDAQLEELLKRNITPRQRTFEVTSEPPAEREGPKSSTDAAPVPPTLPDVATTA